MDVYIARQPILDRRKRAWGYELLFRSGEENHFTGINGDLATSRVLNNVLHCPGVETVTGKKKAFINFTRDLLLKGLPELLDPKKTVVEVLESVPVDEELFHCCRKLTQKGYVLALDDFSCDEKINPLISLAKIVKIDFLHNGVETIQKTLEALSPYRVQFLAEKVETEEEFKNAKDLGFHYFQGYFFSKPQVLKRRDIGAEKLNKLNLLKAIQHPSLDIDALEKLISRDIVLSFKLLKYINSTPLGLKIQVSSIRQASVILGQKTLTRWLSLILLGEIGSEKPRELFTTSTVRAKFCELLSLETGSHYLAPELFTIGMFSLLDAVMDQPMDAILSELSLEGTLVDALTAQKGNLGPYLRLVIAYERGIWPEMVEISSLLGIELKKASESYIKAVHWAENFMISF